jgi:hypothetical protein
MLRYIAGAMRPGPMSAIARRYRFSTGVNRSKRTRKRLSPSAAIASRDAVSTSSTVIGEVLATSHACLPHDPQVQEGERPRPEENGLRTGSVYSLLANLSLSSNIANLLQFPIQS